MMSPSQVTDDLRRRLANLAATADEQIQYLQSLGPFSVDELALELEETLALSWIPLDAGALKPDQLVYARSVDDILKEFSGQRNAHLWTEHGLASSEEWKRVRVAAKKALQALADDAELAE
jgi:hypothetical protein